MQVEDVFRDLPSLETDRLRLRRLRLEDAPDVFAYTSDPEVALYTSWDAHESIDVAENFVRWVTDRYARGQVAPWGVEHKDDGKIIGTCGFGAWATHDARAEIAYALARPDWGRGYTTEAVRTVIDFGFRSMKLNRVYAHCVVENTGSWRVMEKAGMQREGVLRQHVWNKGTFCDVLLYGLLRQDWSQGRTDRVA